MSKSFIFKLLKISNMIRSEPNLQFKIRAVGIILIGHSCYAYSTCENKVIIVSKKYK